MKLLKMKERFFFGNKKLSKFSHKIEIKGKVAKQITYRLYQQHAMYLRWDPSHLLVCVLVCCSECSTSLAN